MKKLIDYISEENFTEILLKYQITNITNTKMCYLYCKDYILNEYIFSFEINGDTFNFYHKLNLEKSNRDLIVLKIYELYVIEFNSKIKLTKKGIPRKINKKKTKSNSEDSKEINEKVPSYKLKEFWKYNLNPITGFSMTNDRTTSTSCINEYYLDKSKL
jgi:hypothetical protein